MPKAFLIVFILCLTFPVVAAAQADSTTRKPVVLDPSTLIVAEVNGKKISDQDLRQEISASFPPEIYRSGDTIHHDIRKLVLHKMIDRLLLEQEMVSSPVEQPDLHNQELLFEKITALRKKGKIIVYLN